MKSFIIFRKQKNFASFQIKTRRNFSGLYQVYLILKFLVRKLRIRSIIFGLVLFHFIILVQALVNLLHQIGN